MGTINTGAIAIGCYLNLDPVQGRAANLIESCFDPFKHVPYNIKNYEDLYSPHPNDTGVNLKIRIFLYYIHQILIYHTSFFEMEYQLVAGIIKRQKNVTKN
ncbi:MAG: hypothetical protein AVO38_02130 [delta proteobacterium ML8_D]|nr:MAG: hypothetical protein AVO38_02130 [delta proteobacterium ML8_D]